MFSGFRAPLGAMLVLVLGTGVVSAGSAVSSADMNVREGPGDEFKVLWTIPAGSQVDLRECNPFQWCFVAQDKREGWVHVRRVDQSPGRKGGGAGSVGDTASSDGDEVPGTPGSTKGGKSRQAKSSGDEGISPIDGASLPGNDTGAGRTAASSGGSGSGGGGNPSTEAATAPKGGRF